MDYRMRDIENFVTAARCRTFVEAAKMLGMGQPSLSESIRRLESDSSRILFYRSKFGIQLTPQGRSFLQSARTVVQACHDLDLPVPGSPGFGNHEITIGCHPTVALYALPSALSALKLKAPDFKISLVHDLSRVIQSEVQRGRIDVGIVINPMAVPDLVIKNVGKDSVNVWSDRPESRHDTVVCNPDLFQTQAILKKWKKKPPKILSTDSLELICRLTAKGIGYGIVPERAVKNSASGLVKLRSLPSHGDTIAVIHRPEFGRSPAERLLIDALKSAFGAKP